MNYSRGALRLCVIQFEYRWNRVTKTSEARVISAGRAVRINDMTAAAGNFGTVSCYWRLITANGKINYSIYFNGIIFYQATDSGNCYHVRAVTQFVIHNQRVIKCIICARHRTLYTRALPLVVIIDFNIISLCIGLSFLITKYDGTVIV